MSDNVVSLSGGAVPEFGEPDEGLVKALEALTEKARTGELQSFVGTGFTSEGLRASIWGGSFGSDVYAFLGSLAWLQHEYVHRLTEDREDHP